MQYFKEFIEDIKYFLSLKEINDLKIDALPVFIRGLIYSGRVSSGNWLGGNFSDFFKKRNCPKADGFSYGYVTHKYGYDFRINIYLEENKNDQITFCDALIKNIIESKMMSDINGKELVYGIKAGDQETLCIYLNKEGLRHFTLFLHDFVHNKGDNVFAPGRPYFFGKLFYDGVYAAPSILHIKDSFFNKVFPKYKNGGNEHSIYSNEAISDMLSYIVAQAIIDINLKFKNEKVSDSDKALNILSYLSNNNWNPIVE